MIRPGYRQPARGMPLALLAAVLLALPVGGLVSFQLFPATTASAATSGSIATGIQSASISPTSTTSYGDAITRKRIADLKQVGANAVTLSFAQYMASTTSCGIAAGSNTPTDAALVSATRYARSIGLNVIYQPFVEIRGGTWRAEINPQGSTRSCWWKAFGAFQKHYAGLAQRWHVSLLVIGTEMVKMASQHMNTGNGAHWRAVIAADRKVYHGKLTYSAQRDGYYGEANTASLAFASQLDYFGISAYYPMKVSGIPSIAKYQAQWAYIERTQIRPIYTKFHKPVVFVEVGYRSLDGARKAPADYGLTGPVNLTEQSQLYQAMLGFWNGVSYFKGLSIWQWDATQSPGGAQSTSFTPQGKPAQGVVAQYYGGSVTTTQPPNPPAPPSSPSPVKIWWPTPSAMLSGCHQPFKAELPGSPLSSYRMDWRVDGGSWVPMYDSSVGGSHKEAIVNVVHWEWHGTGPYKVDFRTTDVSSQAVRPLNTVSIYTLGNSQEVC